MLSDAMILDNKIPLIINNQKIYHESDNTHRFTTYATTANNEHDTPLYNVQGCTVEEAVEAARLSAVAFKSWRKVLPKDRRDIFLKAAAILEERYEEGVSLQMKETQCSPIWAERIVKDAALHLKEWASLTDTLTGDIPFSENKDTLPLVFREPVGPVLAMAAWNAAAILGARSFGTPIAAGCTAIFLTSEVSPASHTFIAEALLDAGLPPGVLQILHKRSEDAPAVTEALIASPYIRKINFTGSTNIGRVISTLAAKQLKPCVLELGGKAATIVAADADVEKAAESIVRGSWLNQGQICMSTERVYVIDNLFDSLVDSVLNQAIKLSPVLASGTQSVRRHAMAFNSLIRDAEAKGARYIYGSSAMHGAQVYPVVLTNVTPNMRVYWEETFGPCFFIERVKSLVDAVNLTNESSYGLAASIWSKDVMKAISIARDIESGAIHINGMTVHDESTLPHGGVKSSGYGNFGSIYGLKEFTIVKTITIPGYNQSY
ncbi:aldehyde dehydrogenase domain-containing protein [Dipodascopsis uninucleata]